MSHRIDIPNIIHFIHLNSRPFTLLHYAAVKLACHHNRQSRICVWNDDEPQGNEWWLKAMELPRVSRYFVDRKKTWRGVAVEYPQHEADIIRLEVLRDYGGVYMDLDILSLKPLSSLLERETGCVIGSECDDEDGKPKSLSNAVIIAAPNHPFILAWINAMAPRWNDKAWAYHSVVLPLELSREHPELALTVLPASAWCPFTFLDDWMMRPLDDTIDTDLRQMYPHSYGIHLWETWFGAYHVTQENLNQPSLRIHKHMKALLEGVEGEEAADADWFETAKDALGELIRCQKNHLFERGRELGQFIIEHVPELHGHWLFHDTYAVHLFYCGNHEESLRQSVLALKDRQTNEDDLGHIRSNMRFAMAKVARKWDDASPGRIEEMKAILDCHSRLLERAEKFRSPTDVLGVLGRPDGYVTITQTTCKRLGLFKRTVSSVLEAFDDMDRILEWIVVDDQSSDADRAEMQRLFPFIRYIFKSVDEKGHARSMNMLIDSIRTPYSVHLEDDWQFFRRDSYISKAIEILECNATLGQVGLNRNYGEDETSFDYQGGFEQFTPSGLRYYIHEHYRRQPSHFTGRNCGYWPHFTLQPAVWRVSAIRDVGRFGEEQPSGQQGFERRFADRYYKAGFQTAFLDNVNCLHIGRKISERNDPTKKNAYDLNNEVQW